MRAASDAVAVAQADLTAATESANASRAAGRDAVALARSARRSALHDAYRQGGARPRPPGAADGSLSGAPRSPARRASAGVSRRHLRPAAAERVRGEEATETAADAARLARRIGVVVPANEVLFFPTLPLRVDTVKVKRGDSITGQVMTVSNSRLAIDSSLSLTDARLVRSRRAGQDRGAGARGQGAVRSPRSQTARVPTKSRRRACTSRSRPGPPPASSWAPR